MKSIFLVFVITVLFLVGMTKFNNDTNYNEALKYAELSQYYDNLENVNNEGQGGNNNVFIDSIDVEVSFSGEVIEEKSITITYASFLSQALYLVGGITTEADIRCINMNYVILTNSSFYIPGGKDLDKVSLNKADREELMTLTSIGGITASKIIEYRETYGNFGCLEDIMNVSGIGQQTFNKIKDSIML